MFMNLVFFVLKYTSRSVPEHTCGHLYAADIRISLRIYTVWSESSLVAFWIPTDAKFFHGVTEDSDQTARTQADLSLRLAHMSEVAFSRVAAYIL